MGTDVSPESSGWAASPRISFSHDLIQSDLFPSTTDERRFDGSLPLEPAATDFDFSISSEVSTHDPSPADELFSNGKILPLPIIKNPGTTLSAPPPTKPNPPDLPAPTLDKKGSLREIMEASDDDDDDGSSERRADGPCRSFWRFGRSSSVGGGRPKAGLICPFPLARSKSTGSYPNPNPIQKPRRSTNRSGSGSGNNSNSQSFRKTSSNPDVQTSYYYSRSKRGSYGNGVKISPVLNVPAPFIPRGGGGSISSSNDNSNTSVLTYLLCNCKDKSMRRSAVSCSP